MRYLDHAATSHPKPAPVLAAVTEWFEALGISADRGDSHQAVEVNRRVAAARRGLGDLVGVPGDRVAFHSGATESLNLALRAALRPGDSVLTTAFEHSSVVRPLRALAEERGIVTEILPPDPDLGLSPARVTSALERLRPRLFVFTHASNVTGAIFDARQFCDAARANGTLTLLDVSQTAGLFDIDVGADLVAGSAHKGLHAPPGLGFLAARPGLELPPQKQGGTGSSAALADHPTTWPAAFEAGTPNTPAILGLAAALGWLALEGRDLLAARALARTKDLEERLSAIPGVRLVGTPTGPRTPVTSFVHDDLDPAELGAMFAAADIHVRTGFHCAPWIHDYLATTAAGTVRISPGPTVTAEDIAAAAAVVAG